MTVRTCLVSVNIWQSLMPKQPAHFSQKENWLSLFPAHASEGQFSDNNTSDKLVREKIQNF